ncbi:MAG TPA: glycosyltransferase family 2 protein [Bryobacteraceae bacterium]|jgi:GT2 family glycosyltransferase|nr:glycosyltransferase family 2 protein [Bryobacteraceae bacterium]
MQVAAVIPNWNGAARLKKLFEHLAAQTYPIGRVIVVDNGSTDDSAAVAAGRGATVIELGANTGFSHAVNCGIQAADAEWILILNNDVLPEPDWLRNLMDTAMAGQAWFATGKLLDASRRDRVDGAFDAICRGACAWRCGHGRRDSALWNTPRQIHFAPLTAALFRAELFQRAGGLDETLESYLEDVDLGIRCAAKGLSGLYVPSAVAYHQGSATLGAWHPDTVRKISRNQLLIVAKHYPRKWILRYGWPVLVAQALWGFIALRHGRLLAYLAGKLDGLRMFASNRGEACSNLAAILDQSEREIEELQSLSGFDLYWRLYFALT